MVCVARCGWCSGVRLALVHKVGVDARAAHRVLENGLEDGLQLRERLDLRHEVHQVRILFCNDETEQVISSFSYTTIFFATRLLKVCWLVRDTFT